ncbi:MAG: SWIM zinc finger family protein [Chlorobiales bacterium]|nr:SWIM zinc finger family protein [Chlorobiales bacterium]
MNIPLSHFEDYIDETILRRGLSYFKKGQVHEPEEIRTGEYEAIVDGTEDYTVRLTIKNDVITEHVCNCPYDLGPICKHVVAVIFYLQQDELELKQKKVPAKPDALKKTRKRKTVAEQVDELLEKTAPDELKQFIREQTVLNVSFRNLFLSSFSQHNSDESRGFYEKQLKSILRSAKDSNGFINWSQITHVYNAVSNLLESAKKHIDNRNFKSAFFICTAIMEQMVDALQYADDSSGEIGGSIDAAYEMIYIIATSQSSEDIRKLIMDYALSAVDKKIYAGWDWHVDMLRVAAILLKTEDEIERLYAALDKELISEYNRDEAQSIKYEIIVKTKGEKEAGEFLEANISNPKLRRKAIQLALAHGNDSKAISIAQGGVDFDKKDKPGLVIEWYDWLLKIAQAQGETEKIIDYARRLFIENFRPEQDYYAILKQHVALDTWVAFVEEVIKDIAVKDRFYNKEQIAEIFIKEGWTERLLELVCKSPDLRTIGQYETYLSGKYTAEVVDLYVNALLEYMKNNVGRSHYKEACRYLRRIIKLGAREKANEVISFFRTEYRIRKALLEELNNV